MEMSIVSDEDESLPERRIGRILIRSAALMRGTIQEGLFTAREGDWLDTGDLGYMADGDLFVTGRRKDIIIKKGRNYSPERLEDLAALSEGVRRAAAFGLYDDTAATEKVILLVEVASRRGEKAEQRDQIRLQARALLRSAGYEVDEVHIVPRGGLPRTTSGKVRRQHAKALFLRGGFGREEST
jgi:acyl-CoA synthetase (AMP-forming)/AMP-acid ligase II